MENQEQVEKFTKELKKAIENLYSSLPGSQEEKEQQIKRILLKQINSKQLALEGKIVALAKDLYTSFEIAKQLGVSQSTVSQSLKKSGIYSYKKVGHLLRTTEMTDKQIAEEGNINIEAVAKLRVKQQQPKPISDIQKQIITLGKDLYTGIEIAKQLGISYQTVSKYLKEHGIFNYKQVVHLLETTKMTDKQIAEEGNVNIEAVTKLREKKQQKKPKPKKISNNQEKIITLGRDLYTRTEIANQLGISQETVSQCLRKYGIYTHKRVVDLLKTTEMTDEQIAKEGNVNVEAVAKLRKKQVIINPLQIIALGRDLYKSIEIAEKLGIPQPTVSKCLREHGIYSYKQVVHLLKTTEMTDKQIAKEGNVNVKAVARLREEKQLKKKEANQKPLTQRAMEKVEESRSEITNVTLLQKKPATSYSYGKKSVLDSSLKTRQRNSSNAENSKRNEETAKKIKFMLCSDLSPQYIKYAIGNITIAQIDEIRKQLEAEKKTKVQNEVQYKIKRIELRSMVQQLVKGGQVSEATAKVLEYKINQMIENFSSFLKQIDYAYMAYGLIKARKYMEALDMGEEYLNLELRTEAKLKEKIEEVIQQEKEREARLQQGEEIGS